VDLLVIDAEVPEENDPRLRRLLPWAHLEMARSMMDGMTLNRIPLEEEESDELDMDVCVAIGLKDRDVEGWALAGIRGSGPL
jgi:hypothetical protein